MGEMGESYMSLMVWLQVASGEVHQHEVVAEPPAYSLRGRAVGARFFFDCNIIFAKL